MSTGKWPTKVYIVASVNYEVFEIDGVFSTKPKAERLRKLLDRDGSSDDHVVGEWVIDERDDFAQSGVLVWDVAIAADGGILWASSKKNQEGLEKAELFSDPAGRVIFESQCWARDEDRAIAVARERRKRLIGAGEFWVEGRAVARELPADVMEKVLA